MKFTTIANAKKETKLSYLGNINISSKLLKNMKVSGQYTYIIYLSPANTSGYNVCSHSTPECRLGCLATSGRAGMEILAGISRTHNCRVKKSRLFFEETAYFMAWMIEEIKYYQRKAIKDGFGFSIRLNCTSDIDWAKVLVDGKNIFQIFSNVQFYDYTKNHLKYNNIPVNYDLTYSFTGRNNDKCIELLKKGFNVAVVFNVKNSKDLPKTFNGYKVIDGDRTDLRSEDEKGVVVGLKWKRIANKENEKKILNSCFVVNPMNDIRCDYDNVQVAELEMV
jgi:hypothetical protein